MKKGMWFENDDKKTTMKNKIHELCFSFFILFLFACEIGAAIFIGMLLMPVAFMVVFILAMREIIVSKRKVKSVKPSFGEAEIKPTAIVRQITSSNATQKKVA